MLVKYIMAGVAASALLATVAFAQSPTTTTDRNNMAPAASSTTNASYQGDWRTSKLVGLNVYNNQNESIGSINDLLTDKSGNIKGSGDRRRRLPRRRRASGRGRFRPDQVRRYAGAVDYHVEHGACLEHPSRAVDHDRCGREPNRAGFGDVVESPRRIRGIRTTRCSTPPRIS